MVFNCCWCYSTDFLINKGEAISEASYKCNLCQNHLLMLLTNYLTLCVLDKRAGLLGGGLINYVTLWVRLSGVLVAKALVANMCKGTV